MKRIAIFGVGGCARGAMPLARWKLAGSDEAHELVFVDDYNLQDFCINSHKVISYEEWVSLPADSRYINIAIADGSIREKLVTRCEGDGVRFFEVRAPNVVQMDEVFLGEGAILCPFVTLTSNIHIGRHFHANIYSYVEHDCVIGDFVTFAPGARCNGNVVIEDFAYIGSGAVIKHGKPGQPLVIGRGAVVGMGAVVVESVPSGVTVVGNPARPLIKS